MNGQLSYENLSQQVSRSAVKDVTSCRRASTPVHDCQQGAFKQTASNRGNRSEAEATKEAGKGPVRKQEFDIVGTCCRRLPSACSWLAAVAFVATVVDSDAELIIWGNPIIQSNGVPATATNVVQVSTSE